MSRRPCIGITAYPPGEAGRYFLAVEYVHAVHRAGGVPLLFPPVGDHAEEWLSRVDAVLFPGGGDIDPLLYGATPHEMIYGVNPTRDAVEMELLRKAYARRIPMLLICRGMQLLNVVLGGTLHQHLPETHGDDVPHRGPERTPTMHRVRIEPGSRLAGILKTMELEVSSLHHQAIDRLAPGLKPAAYASDGVLEACEAPDQWALAVQWHPEATADQDPVQRLLFEALIEKAAARMRAAA